MIEDINTIFEPPYLEGKTSISITIVKQNVYEVPINLLLPVQCFYCIERI